MKSKYLIISGGLLLVVAVLLVACGGKSAPCPTAAPCPEAPKCPDCPTCPAAPKCPDCPTCPTPAVQDVPFEALWVNSGHADAKAMAFNDWNDTETKEIPTSCARCHSTPGYLDFLGADGSEAGKVDKAAPIGTVITCAACHNSTTMALTEVTFPSGVVIKDLGPEARCMVCHQGRRSKADVDKQIADFTATDLDAVPAPIKDSSGNEVKFGFINVHYMAAAAVQYGTVAKGGYEYEGKSYDAKFDHVLGINTCTSCHDQHSLEIKVEVCSECHGIKSVEELKNIREPSSARDYNGNGNTQEGIAAEVQGLQDTLYQAIQAYAKEVAGTGIVYDTTTNPYFFADADGDSKPDQVDGKNVNYGNWTPRLLKAAYNYQFSIKDPGSYAHGGKYIIELLYDSIEDLNTKLDTPIDMSKMSREDAGHFAGDTAPFRDWDAEGEVPAGCARCHSATGLPMYLANSGTLLLTSSGSLQVTGIVAVPTSNGFQCSTCHDTASLPNRLAVTQVVFPSGAKITFSTEKDDKGNLLPADANLCLECHQGRESTASVNMAVAGKDLDTVDAKLGFKNVHYLATGATLFGTEAKGAYEYDGQTYLGRNAHVQGFDTCVACHDVHALNVQIDKCATCHPIVKTAEDVKKIRMTKVDYDGDGNMDEGISDEVTTMQEKLYAEMQKYAETKAGKPILYSSSAYPYFFVDADKDGKPDVDDKGATLRYDAWTPRLLEAAYNYQYSFKDPGAFAHNSKYIIQILYDSIKSLGGDAAVAGLTRP